MVHCEKCFVLDRLVLHFRKLINQFRVANYRPIDTSMPTTHVQCQAPSGFFVKVNFDVAVFEEQS